MLYSVTSPIDDAAPPVGSSPGLGSSAIAITIASLRPWASTPGGRVARAASEALCVRTLRRFSMSWELRERGLEVGWNAGDHPRLWKGVARGRDRGRGSGSGTASTRLRV